MQQVATKTEKLTGTASSDPLADCISNMIKAMKADFGSKFKSQFDNTEDLRNYKRRLYQVLRHRDVKNIYQAYDRYALSGKEWPPTVPELVSVLDEIEKEEKKHERENAQHEQIVSLPKPTRSCDPMQMLREAKLDTPELKDQSEWMRRKSEKAMLNQAMCGHLSKRYADGAHKCGYNGCYRSGSLSSSRNGSEHWYCSEHFRQV